MPLDSNLQDEIIEWMYGFEATKDDKKNCKLTFLMFSRMLHSKGIMEYLSAVKSLNKDIFNKADFLLLGGAYPFNQNKIDGEWLSGVDAIDPDELLLKTNQAGVKWLGHDSNVLNYLSISDVVVLPTYYPEGLPRSLLEAMSCENAIITTNTPGCRDVVDGTNGFLVEPKNTKQLTKSIENCIKMNDFDLMKMKQRSREIVKNNFSDEIIIESYKKLYQE